MKIYTFLTQKEFSICAMAGFMDKSLSNVGQIIILNDTVRKF